MINLLDSEMQRSVLFEVPVRAIRVDHDYQRRSPSSLIIRDMARNWDDQKAGVIYLNFRDNSFWCIDGQTRVEALRLAHGDEAFIKARCFDGLSKEREAELFDVYNRNRRQPTPYDTFKARIMYREPSALAIRNIVEDLGIELGPSHGSVSNRISAISALDTIYQQFGGLVLRKTLQLLRDAWGDSYIAYLSVHIKGLAYFFARYPDASRDRIIKTLKNQGHENLLARSSALGGKTRTQAHAGTWGQVLRSIYNIGLRRNQLEPWEERVSARESSSYHETEQSYAASDQS